MKTKSLAQNSIYYLVYNVLNVAFPLFTGIYVARILLPTDIGQVETARNLAQYFVIFSFLGIPTYGLREISKYRNNKDELNKLYSELMVINTISTFIFLILYNFIIFIVPTYRNNIYFFLITGISIALNFINNSWLFEGLEKFDYISIRNFLFKLLSLVLLLIFVRDKSDYLVYAFITVVGTAGNYLLNVISSKKYVKFIYHGLNLKRHMKSIIYLVVVNFAIEIYTMIDITMLGLMCEKQIVTFYSYGMKIQKVLLQVINTFTMVLVPRISLYYKEQKLDEYNRLLTKTLAVILILSIPIIVGVYFVGTPMIILLYGESYIRSADVLKIIIFAILISPVGYLLGSRVMLVTGHENKMVIAVCCGALINAIGNYLLIPKFFEIGAAYASIAGESMVAVLYVFLSHDYFKLDYSSLMHTVCKIVLSIFVMVMVLMIIEKKFGSSFLSVILQFIGAVLVYFGVLVFTKESTVFTYYTILKHKLKIK